MLTGTPTTTASAPSRAAISRTASMSRARPRLGSTSSALARTPDQELGGRDAVAGRQRRSPARPHDPLDVATGDQRAADARAQPVAERADLIAGVPIELLVERREVERLQDERLVAVDPALQL